MGWWEEHVVPRVVDLSLRSEEVGRLREQVCAPLAGRVLELGFGSGLNLRWYPPAVSAVDAVEPSDVGWRLSEQHRDRARAPVTRIGLDGQRLDVPDASYDAVLCTFTLCTIPDPTLALDEVRRVLRPGGSLCFCEHGRAPTARVQAWQHRLEPLQRRLGGGCHLTRDPAALLSAAGLRVTELTTGYLPGPAPARPFTYIYRGAAAA
ncbi:MAG: class I SAM-dependent methyltransferase [Marmoricola sp.]